MAFNNAKLSLTYFRERLAGYTSGTGKMVLSKRVPLQNIVSAKTEGLRIEVTNGNT